MELGEDLKKSNAAKKIYVGAVYYVKDSEANKLKMHVIVGLSSGSLTSVAVR